MPLDIPYHRLHSQHIATPDFATPADVVRSLGAMQGQDFLGAMWAIGMRMRNAVEADVERAVIDRSIVRLWFMRGTLHFLAAEDVRWMNDLMSVRLKLVTENLMRYGRAEMDAQGMSKALDIVLKALEGTQLTREELGTALEQGGIPVEGFRLSFIMQMAQNNSLVCHGARRGKQFTFALMDDWLPPASKRERDIALVDFTRRYFTGHAPATLQDFVAWSGLTLTEARAGLEGAKADLEQETIDGKPYWFSPSTVPARKPKNADSDVYLLSGFDEYMLGYQDRTMVLDTERQKIWRGKNAIFTSLIVIGGRVVGFWSRTIKKKQVIIDLKPFDPLTDAQLQKVREAADRYGTFLGLEAVTS